MMARSCTVRAYISAQSRDGIEQLAAVPDNYYAEVLCPADSGPGLEPLARNATKGSSGLICFSSLRKNSPTARSNDSLSDVIRGR
jgi:hypothetical protein